MAQAEIASICNRCLQLLRLLLLLLLHLSFHSCLVGSTFVFKPIFGINQQYIVESSRRAMHFSLNFIILCGKFTGSKVDYFPRESTSRTTYSKTLVIKSFFRGCCLLGSTSTSFSELTSSSSSRQIVAISLLFRGTSFDISFLALVHTTRLGSFLHSS